jgi:exosortase/archaeosortase family protein
VSRQNRKSRQKSPERSLKGGWQSWYASKSPVLRFVLKFGILMALFYGLSATSYYDRMLYSYLEANAWLSNSILNGFGQHTHVSGVSIESPQFAIVLRRGCDAAEPTWLFSAAVLSFRAPLIRKLPGVLAGIVVLQVLNLLRIVTLYWIGLHLPDVFNSAHMEVWPTAFVVVAIVLFICWIEWSGKETTTHAVS